MPKTLVDKHKEAPSVGEGGGVVEPILPEETLLVCHLKLTTGAVSSVDAQLMTAHCSLYTVLSGRGQAMLNRKFDKTGEIIEIQLLH
jgi:hypothetical protein